MVSESRPDKSMGPCMPLISSVKNSGSGLFTTLVGAIPYFLRERGMTIPPWAVTIGGVVVIVGLGITAWPWVVLILDYVSPRGIRTRLKKWIFTAEIDGVDSSNDANRSGSGRVIGTLIVACLVSAAIVWWLMASKAETQASPPSPSNSVADVWSDRLEPIVGKTFTNEKVEIDNKIFDNCRFENVTLLYRGRGPYVFIKGQVKGTIAIETDSKPASVFYNLLNFFRMQPGGQIRVGTRNVQTGETKFILEGSQPPKSPATMTPPGPDAGTAKPQP